MHCPDEKSRLRTAPCLQIEERLAQLISIHDDIETTTTYALSPVWMRCSFLMLIHTPSPLFPAFLMHRLTKSRRLEIFSQYSIVLQTLNPFAPNLLSPANTPKTDTKPSITSIRGAHLKNKPPNLSPPLISPGKFIFTRLDHYNIILYDIETGPDSHPTNATKTKRIKILFIKTIGAVHRSPHLKFTFSPYTCPLLSQLNHYSIILC